MINNNYSRKDHCNDPRKSFYTKAPPFRVAPNIRYQPEPNCSQPQIPQEEIKNIIFLNSIVQILRKLLYNYRNSTLDRQSLNNKFSKVRFWRYRL